MRIVITVGTDPLRRLIPFKKIELNWPLLRRQTPLRRFYGRECRIWNSKLHIKKFKKNNFFLLFCVDNFFIRVYIHFHRRDSELRHSKNSLKKSYKKLFDSSGKEIIDCIIFYMFFIDKTYLRKTWRFYYRVFILKTRAMRVLLVAVNFSK